MKLLFLSNQSGQRDTALFYCPACQKTHPFSLNRWSFNGEKDRPTFSPSLLVHPRNGQVRCHLFLREGRIEYCSDCEHQMAGMTVSLPDIPITDPWHPDFSEGPETQDG